MVIAQIRYFLILYEELNFTRAAELCDVSQPSLTNGIKSLERQYGGRLFDRARSPRSQTQPTELAQALKPHFERIIDSAGQARKIAERLSLTIASTKKNARRCPDATSRKAIRRAKGMRLIAANGVAQRLTPSN
jgi:DNA-binding transcriptional LysR family regulator